MFVLLATRVARTHALHLEPLSNLARRAHHPPFNDRSYWPAASRAFRPKRDDVDDGAPHHRRVVPLTDLPDVLLWWTKDFAFGPSELELWMSEGSRMLLHKQVR